MHQQNKQNCGQYAAGQAKPGPGNPVQRPDFGRGMDQLGKPPAQERRQQVGDQKAHNHEDCRRGHRWREIMAFSGGSKNFRQSQAARPPMMNEMTENASQIRPRPTDITADMIVSPIITTSKTHGGATSGTLYSESPPNTSTRSEVWIDHGRPSRRLYLAPLPARKPLKTRAALLPAAGVRSCLPDRSRPTAPPRQRTRTPPGMAYRAGRTPAPPPPPDRLRGPCSLAGAVGALSPALRGCAAASVFQGFHAGRGARCSRRDGMVYPDFRTSWA